MSVSQERKGSTASARRKSVAEEQVTSVLAANQVIIYDRELTADEEALAALGYKCVFPVYLDNDHPLFIDVAELIC